MNPNQPENRVINPYADHVVNLGEDYGTGAVIRLECSGCPPRDRISTDESEDFEELPALTTPVRYDDDPKTVVRCAACGKKHSESSLTIVEGNV